MEIESPELLPLVSVIVATYRRDKTLFSALESIINQTYKKLEVIVVDDNAELEWNKRVQKIFSDLEMYSGCVMKYIRNTENLGSAETRNIGIRNALGEYITFLDDDDIYLDLKIERQVVPMIENAADYSITNLLLFDENGILIDQRIRDYLRNVDEKTQLIKCHLKFHMTGTDTLMFRKKFLVQIGGFPRIDAGDEFYLMEKAILAEGKLLYLNHCYVKAIIHSTTIGMSSGDSKINGEIELFKHKKKFFEILNNDDIRYIKARHYAVLAFAELRRKKKIKCVKYCFFALMSGPISCLRIILSTKVSSKEL
ncbi:glycosyltransferase family 2 protein [Cohnella sp. 56]|uniref:glycosyltransferase family 2 protein n=1 Tax=Cohnella sp. 56 TaxID=3113722 RepID=UPI0030EB09E7